MCESHVNDYLIICLFNFFVLASPAITIPAFKALINAPESQAVQPSLLPIVEVMQQDIQHLEQRLATTERTLDRLVSGILQRLRQDSNAVPAWLLPLLQPQAEVPRVDVASGHTIGRAIYSPKSQKPKQVSSTHFMKYEEDDDEFNSESVGIHFIIGSIIHI